MTAPISLEDRIFLESRIDRQYVASLPNESNVLAMRGAYTEVKIDPREFMQVENQGSQGACQGHSLSSVMEWCWAIATGGDKIQLSRAFAYYESQRMDGINGDRGSVPSTGIRLGSTVGVPLEELWKYPAKYDNGRPSNFEKIKENAANHVIGSSTKITSYDGFRTFVGSGQGGVHTGITWNDSLNRSVVETFVVNDSRDGGHSICGLSLSERTDQQGRPYIWIMNSWSKQFGTGGWQEWSPSAIMQMLQHRTTVFIGASDMKAPKPRDLTFEEFKKGLRI